ncbi:MAG: DUF1232 domain-containing protein [Pseudomonadota bacterium]
MTKMTRLKRLATKLVIALMRWARHLMAEINGLIAALFDPQTPWAPCILMFVVVAYAVSPLDLIPDFIPVIGFLDELILLPLGIKMVALLMPDELMQRHRDRALAGNAELPRGFKSVAIILVVATWLALAAVIWWWFWSTSSAPLGV